MGKGSITSGDVGVSYAGSDIVLFEKMMDYPDVEVSEHRDDIPPHGAPLKDAIQYTEHDARLFRELMTFEPRHASGEPAHRGAGRVYSDQDDQLFENLMSFDREQTTATPIGGNRPPAASRESVAYTQEDLESFHRLAPGATQAAEERKEPLTRPSRKDRDVGHIRIVDVDKENSNEERDRIGDDSEIKIRFFD